MLADNRIRTALRAGGISRGINVQTNSPEIVEMVGHAGYDHVMIDWEHGSFGTGAVVSMIRAAQIARVTPIVRVPGHDDAPIKRVLDAGAAGIVVPHVETRAQAERVTASARYRDGDNGGRRGACPSVRAANHLTTDWKAFARRSNTEVFVAISIESSEGVRNYDDIAHTPGMDALFLGTFDLAHEMGHFGDSKHPDVVAAVDRLIAISRTVTMPIFATLFLGRTRDEVRDEEKRWREAGASIFNLMSDRRLVSEGLSDRLASLR